MTLFTGVAYSCGTVLPEINENWRYKMVASPLTQLELDTGLHLTFTLTSACEQGLVPIGESVKPCANLLSLETFNVFDRECGIYCVTGSSCREYGKFWLESCSAFELSPSQCCQSHEWKSYFASAAEWWLSLTLIFSSPITHTPFQMETVWI